MLPSESRCRLTHAQASFHRLGRIHKSYNNHETLRKMVGRARPTNSTVCMIRECAPLRKTSIFKISLEPGGGL